MPNATLGDRVSRQRREAGTSPGPSEKAGEVVERSPASEVKLDLNLRSSP
jgi:hypothetical protein